MNNKEIYKKTLTFSLRRFLWDFGSLAFIVLASALGFWLSDNATGNGFYGLAIGLLIAALLVAIFSHFISYIFKAGQIAMMTEGITKGKLPEDVYGAGKKVVKERFLTVAAYYAATRVIKGIFNQIGRVITNVGKSVGGDAGNAVGTTISSIIQTIVSYLCDCCLGWVFYQKDKNAAKATLEGAVLFFKHGKTLAKNLGRVFGFGALSLLVIGGAFFGIAYLICMAFPGAFEALAAEVTELANNGEVNSWLANANNLMIVAAAISGLVLWGIINSAFVRPFILVGVLRNYIESGKKETITEKDFDVLDKKSSKFKELHKAES